MAYTHPYDNFSDRVLISIFQVLAMTMTLVRLARRVRISRFAWDDIWAAISLVILTVQAACEWVRIGYREGRENIDPSVYQSKAKLFMSLALGLFTAVVWTSRISLSLSIARILPPSRLRQTALFIAMACLIFGTVITPLKTCLCTLDYTQDTARFTCQGGNTVFITQVAGDIISSAILVIFPIYALRLTSSNLPADERRLIFLLMTGTLLTLGVCLAQSFFVIKQEPFGMTYSAKMESAIALMVCNLLVVVTSIYRFCTRTRRRSSNEDGEDREEEYNSGEKSITIATAGGNWGWGGSITTLSSTTSESTSLPSQLTDIRDSLPTISLRSFDLNSHNGSPGSIVGRNDPDPEAQSVESTAIEGHIHIQD
ncbi:hypothetical protein L218DRAFT_468676 [Marasmius fiardii PR-910]|nr:hypothetical protein L218DRAFT_468676 [Marasmius fiardii PR-910]